jgi:Protein phosphatase inhibitor 2 (IPP-2)
MSTDGRAPGNFGSELENRLAAGSTVRNVAPEELEYVDDDDRMGRPTSANGAESEVQQKKPRLQWDEDNLLSNALEKERNPYPKIDEPKTPYHALSGSEGGSSSGSAPQSPGSPAFIPRDQLVGFADLERSASRTSSDGHPRSVQIAEDAGASSGGDSSPRSREEFKAKRSSRSFWTLMSRMRTTLTMKKHRISWRHGRSVERHRGSFLLTLIASTLMQ